MTRPAILIAAALLAAGCGSKTAEPEPAGEPTVVDPAPTTTAATGPAPDAKPFRATLEADGHTPRVGDPWHYTVRARDLDGKPVGGSVIVRVLQNGEVIDTIGQFAFDGTFRDEVSWRADKRGKRLLFQVEVNATGSFRKVDYDLRVR